jgi:spermidine synthase
VKPTVTLAETTTPDGCKLSLRSHDGHFHLSVGGHSLMSTRATNSETRLAELGCERLGDGAGRRVLIGGLGLGFTLRRTLELVPAAERIEVAELMPEVVEWNRRFMQSFNGALVDDPRVTIVIADVYAALARAAMASLDAVLLDVDNGPSALVASGNSRLYTPVGLRVVSRALRPGGRAVFWSARPDPSFLGRLATAGFRAEAAVAKGYSKSKRAAYTLFVADWSG